MVSELIEKANQTVIERMFKSQPMLIGIGTAIEDIPDMDENTILHAGPPITWEKMSGPLKGAVIGALIYEKRAQNEEEAVKLAQSGKIKFSPCHHHSAVGPMAGVVSPSMPVWIIKDKTYGHQTYCTFNEGLGKVLRFGAYSADVIEHLSWMEKELAPVLKQALEIHGEIDLKSMIAQALQMGDEGHNRNRAGTSLLIREIVPAIMETSFPKEQQIAVIKFINSNDHFFLNLTMPACKCILQAGHGIEYSTIVTTLCRNGTEFGIRVSGLGDRWFTGPAGQVKGLFFPGFSQRDANPDIGDSAITETAGIGGFAIAAAPAIVQFVGGSASDAVNYTNRMYEITVAESNVFKIPYLDFKGSPTGIDLRKVIETGIVPQINSGIAHKDPGVGQIGAGLVTPPMKCFEDALEAFVMNLEEKEVIEK
jgi:hypothetical protein